MKRLLTWLFRRRRRWESDGFYYVEPKTVNVWAWPQGTWLQRRLTELTDSKKGRRA